MSFALTVGSDGQAATAQVVWSVDSKTYSFRSDNNFLSWITTIFTIADVISGNAPDYRLLRPTPATNNATGNIGIGVSALAAVTSAVENLAIGTKTLNLFATGTGNIGIGHQAADVLTTGDSNIFIGANAGGLLTSGNRNVAVGANALNGTGDGKNSNTCIGHAAGLSVTIGDSNTLIGREAAIVIGTESYCIALGHGATAPASGSLAIGGTGGDVMTNLNVATAGAVAVGEYLNIYINGVQRKIALLLP